MSDETVYCLRSDSTYRGKPLWFMRMTGIGPMTTAHPTERAVFASREAALASPAMRHMLSTFEPEPVSAGAVR